MTPEEIIALAEKHVNNGAAMQSSAQFSLDNAKRVLGQKMPDAAKLWATNSLAHSVGVFHEDYEKAIGL